MKNPGTTGKTWKAPHPTQQGEDNHRAKLTTRQVMEIRHERWHNHRSIPALAERYGVHRKTVWNIINRITWGHL